MYNSRFISVLAKIYTVFSDLYSDSVIHKMAIGIKAFIKNLSRHSAVIYFFTADDSLIKKSYVYRVYRGLMRVLDFVIVKLNKFFKKLTKHSGVADAVSYYNSGSTRLLRMIYLFLMFSGIGIVLMGLFSIKTTYGLQLGGVLFLLGIVGIFINGHEARMVKNSKVLSFVGDLFKLDEGGEHWW